jgi:aspartokinase/homoserine dehydrogenase 1
LSFKASSAYLLNFGLYGSLQYLCLRELQRQSYTHYFYEATVGAGLPIISTLRGLNETGDKIIKIEGIFSGTLSYIFNNFKGDKSFSQIVREAKMFGFTEPDPRDDLSGMDVARKVGLLLCVRRAFSFNIGSCPRVCTTLEVCL